MSKIMQYKTEIDSRDKSEIKRIMTEAENDSEIDYVEKQQILGYGNYKIDSFEDAIIYFKNAITHINEMRKYDRDAYKHYVSNSLGDFLAGYILGRDGAGETTGGECCSICCMCGACCCSCDCFWDKMAPQSDCCLIKNCAPSCSDCAANTLACGMNCCCTAPIEACTGCCF